MAAVGNSISLNLISDVADLPVGLEELKLTVIDQHEIVLLQRITTLKFLSIGSCSIALDNLFHFGPTCFASLEVLHLPLQRSTYIMPTAMIRLMVKCCKKLIAVTCENPTPSGIREMIRRLPNLVILEARSTVLDQTDVNNIFHTETVCKLEYLVIGKSHQEVLVDLCKLVPSLTVETDSQLLYTSENGQIVMESNQNPTDPQRKRRLVERLNLGPFATAHLTKLS